MKKLGAIFASLALALSLTACAGNESAGGVSVPSPIQTGSSSSSSTASSAGSSSENSSSAGSSEASSATESSSSSISESSATSSSSSGSGSSASSSSAASSKPEQSSSMPAQSSSTPVQSSSKPAQSSSKPAQSSSRPVQSSSAPSSQPTPETEKTLVVYFTWSSNTKQMANTIVDLTGADVFELVPVTPYPEAYTPCTEVALEERDSNARPAIKNLPASVSQYDNIIIGYPIWWHTAPMIIGTFLEHYDLSGIDVYPFTQSASMNTEQFNNSMGFVRGCAKNATVHDGLFTRYSNTSAIESYLRQNGLAK